MLSKFIEIYILNKQKNKWLHNRTYHELKENLIEELNELEEALKSNDKEKIICEVGDVIMDSLNILAWVVMKKGLSELDVLAKAIKKQTYRKPWLYQDQELSEEEQVNIWFKRKAKKEC